MSVAAGAQAEMSHRAKMLVMGATLLGLFVAAMDQTVVSTALPRIVSELGGFDRFSWVFTAYMLTSTVTAPVWGKLSDIWGRKPFLMLGVALFVATSVATGASQTMTQLIMFRGLQGIGAGMIMACAFTMIGDIFTPKERGKYQGLFAGVFGLASIVGPTLGGAVTDHLSWRWAFYINIPVGLVALPVLWKVLPVIKHGRRGAIDYAGSLLLAAAVTPLLLAFVWAGQDYAWNSVQIVGLFTASFAMTLAFLLAEWKADDPIIPLHLFKNGTYNIASLTTFLTGMGIFGATVYVPLFVQGVIGASATNSGTVMAPMMAGLIVSSAITGNLVSRTGRYKIPSIIGTMIMTGGLYLLSTMGADTTRLTATAFMAVLGFGVGMVMPTMNVVAQNAMPMHLLGVVTSNLQFYRSIGGTVGVAIMGTIVTNQLRSKLPPLDERAQSLPEPVLERLRDPQALVNPEIRTLLQGAFSQIEDGAAILASALEGLRLALADSLEWTFLVGVFLSGATLVALLFLKEAPLRRTFESPPPEGFAPEPEGGPGPTAALPPPPAAPVPEEAPQGKPSPVGSPEVGTAGTRAVTLPALDWGISRPDRGQGENGTPAPAPLAGSPPLAGGAPAGEPASVNGDVTVSAARNGAEPSLRLPPPPPPIPSNGRPAPAPAATAPRIALPPPPPPIPGPGRPPPERPGPTSAPPVGRTTTEKKQGDTTSAEPWRVVVAEFSDVRSPDLAAELVLALTRMNGGCRVRSFSFEDGVVRAEILVSETPSPALEELR